MTSLLSVPHISRIAHEVNRAYCAAIGDPSQVSWDEAPQWQKDSAMAGVLGIISGDITKPSDSHESWMAQKLADGWKYGKVKDPEALTHPCIVDYDKLPPEQQTKDYLFFAVVTSYLNGLEE